MFHIIYNISEDMSCQSGQTNTMCDLRKEMLNVLLEAALVFFVVGVITRLFSWGPGIATSKALLSKGSRARGKAVAATAPPPCKPPPSFTAFAGNGDASPPSMPNARPFSSAGRQRRRPLDPVPPSSLVLPRSSGVVRVGGVGAVRAAHEGAEGSAALGDGLSEHLGAQAQRRRRLAQYVSVNSLSDSCVSVLRSLSDAQLGWVMDQRFVYETGGGSHPSELVFELAKEAAQKNASFWSSYPTREDVQKCLAEYVVVNCVDRMCEKMLSSLSTTHIRKVMDHEFIVQVNLSKGTASAKIVGHVLRFRKEL